MSNEGEIAISVIVLVYNHEAYIETCLDSLFQQKVNVPVEFVIGDDHSTDRSEEVIRRMIDQYQNCKVNYFRNDPNLGLMQNFSKCMSACHGKYIAICAGDDYWLSEKKLQTQYDILEKDPSIICSTTDTLYLEGETYKKYSYVETKSSWLGEHLSSEVSFDQLANRCFPHPNTMLFRSFGELPSYFLRFMCEDYPLFLLLSSKGKVHYLNEKWTAYRIHEASYVQSAKATERDHKYSLQFIDIQFTMLQELGAGHKSQMIVAIENEVNRLIEKHLGNEGFLEELKAHLITLDKDNHLDVNGSWKAWRKSAKLKSSKKQLKNWLSSKLRRS